jgi:AcrR family transcriptional regulator
VSTPTKPRRARQQRSLATEARILDAATRLFLSDGYAATTMAAIAGAAEVSVQSLYLRFGGKLDILTAALDVAIVGDTEPVALLDRAWFAELREAADGPTAARLLAGEMAAIMSRTYPVYEVVLRAGDEARDLLATTKAQRYEGLRAVAEVLAGKPGFAGLTTDAAADRLYGVLSEEGYGLLVAERGWSPQAWAEWTAELLAAVLFSGAR